MDSDSLQTDNQNFVAELAKNLIAGLTVGFVAISLCAAFGILSIHGQTSGPTLYRLPLPLASDAAFTKTIEGPS